MPDNTILLFILVEFMENHMFTSNFPWTSNKPYRNLTVSIYAIGSAVPLNTLNSVDNNKRDKGAYFLNTKMSSCAS